MQATQATETIAYHWFVVLSQEQAEAVDGWLDNRRLRVRGGAGTGKTLVALEAAKRLAEQGERVLLLCFNRYLARRLREEIAGLSGSQIEACNFHTLCAEAHGLLDDGPMDVPVGAGAMMQFWNEEAPGIIVEALEADKLQRWDAIVVDEGQDFAPAWWPVLEECLVDKERGRMLVCYDPWQNIVDQGDFVPDYPTVRLTINYRNSKQIAEVVRHLGDPSICPFDGCPAGEPPQHHELPSPDELRQVLGDLIETLTDGGVEPDQITILTPHSQPNSSLVDVVELASIALSHEPARRAGKLFHTTIGKFKGLESDVVIFADVDPTSPRCSRRARYVAASRAKHLLHVFAKGDWLA